MSFYSYFIIINPFIYIYIYIYIYILCLIVGNVNLCFLLQLNNNDTLATPEDNSELSCIAKWSLCTALATLLVVIITIIYASFWIGRLHNEISSNSSFVHPIEDLGSSIDVTLPPSLEIGDSRYLCTFNLPYFYVNLAFIFVGRFCVFLSFIRKFCSFLAFFFEI